MDDKKEWTPGPWKRCGADRGGCICGMIWSIPADCSIATTEHEYDGRDDKAPPIDEAKANTALISAAPELYDGLEKVMLWIRNWEPNFSSDPEWQIDKARVEAALKKARGEN